MDQVEKARAVGKESISRIGSGLQCLHLNGLQGRSKTTVSELIRSKYWVVAPGRHRNGRRVRQKSAESMHVEMVCKDQEVSYLVCRTEKKEGKGRVSKGNGPWGSDIEKADVPRYLDLQL